VSDPTALLCRPATQADLSLLAEWNRQLIEDEQHRNRHLTLAQLEARMRGFLAGEYRAAVFELANQPVGYALFRPDGEGVYLRQLFIRRECRRQGIGRRAVALLREQVWPPDRRISVEVLRHNQASLSFWRAVGFADYSLTLELPPRSR
jgi:ribosomal protein S18 acetylase RimI-like enzyme